LFMSSGYFSFFVIGGIIGVFGQSVFRVIIASQVAGSAGEKRRGEALGILSSFFSVSLVLGPVLAGVLFEKNIKLPFLANVVYLLLAVMVLYHDRKRIARLKLSENSLPEEIAI